MEFYLKKGGRRYKRDCTYRTVCGSDSTSLINSKLLHEKEEQVQWYDRRQSKAVEQRQANFKIEMTVAEGLSSLESDREQQIERDKLDSVRRNLEVTLQ